MALSLVQSIQAATSATGATSITPTLGAGSTAGNLLLLSVTVTATNPTITTPAGWALIQRQQGASLAVALFAQQSNAGGVTAVAVTIGGTSVQGAVAQLFEFNCSQGSGVSIGSGQQSLAVTALTNIFAGAQCEQTNELIVYLVGRVASTLTPANAGIAWSATTSAAVSTNGTPNAQLDFFWGTNLGPGPLPSAAGTLSSGVASTQIQARFTSNLSNQITFSNVGGQVGVLAGGYYSGMVGG